jgi:hypothetical protein
MGRLVAVVGIVAAILGGVIGHAAGGKTMPVGSHLAAAADDCQTFPETGKTVCGVFLRYWREHGGLAQQGLPLSDAANERSEVDGQIYLMQYFERAVFEHHPENQPPYDVLLSLLGREKYLAKRGAPTGARPAIVGQQVNVLGIVAATGSYSQPLRVEVLDLKDGVTILNYGQPLKPSGKFVVVFLRVANLGPTPGRLLPNALILADGLNRQAFYAMTPTSAAAAQYRLSYYGTNIEPGLSDDQVLVFDVQPDASDFRLVVASGFQPK